MANLKFSQFQEQTDPANVQFVVGYNGTDNVRIDPANLAPTAPVDSVNTQTGVVSLGLTDLDDVGADGTSGQVLTTDGSGSFTFADAGGGGGASSLNDLTDVLIDGTSSYFVDIPASLTGNPIDNVVIGDSAGSSLTSGRSNTLIGHDAGKDLSDRSYNTCIGYQSGNNFNGNFNTVIGGNAGLTGSTTPSNAVSVGYQAGLASYVTSVGYRAGSSATGVYGTYVGYEPMRTNTGAFNIGVGYRAGQNNATGTNNVYIGKEAGKANTAGAQKTCVGDTAGSTSTGSNVTLIGYNSQPSVAAAANEITLGDSNVATLRCAVTTITSLSDERDKSEIKDLEYGLDFIDSLQPREFVWDNRAEIKKQDVLDENGEPSLDDDGNIVTENVEFYSANKGKKDFGFIAQEVKELDNDTLRLVYSENVEKLEMSYGKLVPILVKAIQELKAEVDSLKQLN